MEANNHIIISGISSKSREDTPPEQGSPSVEQGESSDGTDPPASAYQLAVADHDREYGCRYCHKKFSNKQALGGHQNAHKVERAMEKNVQETSGISYYEDDPYPPRMNAPAPFLGSIHHHDFLHRTSLFSWRGGSGGVVAYNPRPGAQYPYAPFSAPARTLPGHDGNVRLPNFGPGSSGAFRSVRNQGPPGFSGFMIRPRCSNPAAVNLRNVPGNQHDESGLDLSLKLG